MASVNFNMNNNSDLGDINNCNSLNSSVASSPIVNSIRRNSFYKLTHVLLLLFLVFGSCVVNFGMENVNENKPSVCKALLLAFAPGLITGIGGYDNTWRPLNENRGLYWYRHNIYSISIIDNLLEKFLSFCDKIPIFGKLNRIGWSFVRGGVNYHIPFKFPFTNFDMDLHIFGINFLANFEDGLLAFIDIFNGFISYHIFQVLDLEIKVAKYYSISINMIFPLVFMWLSVIIGG
jgi:hypothetical protein